jgi:hypothetical protein
VIDYKATIRNHLRPVFGQLDLARLSQQPRGVRAVRSWKRSLMGSRRRPFATISCCSG